MSDIIGTADMTQGTPLTTFVSDRFGNPSSALSLNGGYTQVPAGIYFNSPQFSISAWVYPLSVINYARVVDFGNGANSNNILLALGSPGPYPLFLIVNGATQLTWCVSSQALVIGQWQFFAATFDGSYARMYINGLLTCTVQLVYYPTNLLRSYNYFGKSNWNDGSSSSYLDDLRFFNVSLSQSDIVTLMNSQTLTGMFLRIFLILKTFNLFISCVNLLF